LASFERDPKGGIDVMGTHAYAKPGTFAVSSALTETPWNGGGVVAEYILNLGEVNTQATVSPTPPLFNETAGKSYSANIDWGDGNKTDGTVTFQPLSSTSFIKEVVTTGTHAYPKPGLYKVTTRVYSRLAIVGHEGKQTLAEEFVALVRVTASA
jgi:hypothetical protein